MILFISSFITKELIGLFIFYWVLTRIIHAAALYAVRTAEKRNVKIAVKNFYFARFINKLILAIPILALAFKIIIA